MKRATVHRTIRRHFVGYVSEGCLLEATGELTLTIPYINATWRFMGHTESRFTVCDFTKRWSFRAIFNLTSWHSKDSTSRNTTYENDKNN
jgi:hypothetical protein